MFCSCHMVGMRLLEYADGMADPVRLLECVNRFFLAFGWREYVHGWVGPEMDWLTLCVCWSM